MCGVTCFSIFASVDVLAKDLPRAHARERRAARVEKERALPRAALELRPELALIDGDRGDRTPPDRHEPLLASFAEHAHETLVEQRVLHAERDPLGDAQPRAVRELEQRAVAKGERLVERRRGEQPLDIGDREHVGEREPALRRLEALRWILRDLALADQKAIIGAHRRDVAADGRRRESHVLEMVDVRAEHRRRDRRRRRRALHARVGREAREIAMVRLARGARRALLHRHEVVESLEEKVARDLVDYGHVATGATVATIVTTRGARR